MIDFEDLEKIASKLGARFNSNSYFACRDMKGNVVFVPTRTSRHTHTIVVMVSNEEEFGKVSEWIREKGFDVIENCLVMPES